MSIYDGSVPRQVATINILGCASVDPVSKLHENLFRPYECDACHRTFSRQSELIQHNRAHTGEKPFECNQCGKRFSSSQIWVDHIRVHAVEKTHSCEVCGNVFANNNKLTNHRKKHESISKRICVICGEMFTREKTYDIHLSLHYPDDGDGRRDSGQLHSNTAISCGGETVSPENSSPVLTENQQIVNGTTPEQQVALMDKLMDKDLCCKVCEVPLQTKKSFIEHNIKHTDIKSVYACKTCDRKFFSKEIVEEHIRIHTGEKPFPCYICGHRLRLKSTWSQHIRLHTVGKPYNCDECGKRFSSKTLLTDHSRIHTGKKEFVCSTCQNRFTQKSALKAHMVYMHSQDRLHPCSQCDYRAARACDLRRHVLRKHGVGASFQCIDCKRNFYSKDLLERHMKTHAKPIACSICKETFSSKTDFILHKNSHDVKIIHFTYQPCNPDPASLNTDAVGDELMLFGQTEEVPKESYSCKVCNKEFPDQTSLEKHEQAFAGKKPYKCGHCGKYFHIKVCAQKHILGHINNKSSKAKISATASEN
uniref:zinc finger protein 883-like n=1 Tax=Styela clava TaxID=7725 RepID=UPI00193978F1|nr:zinc finger protein 883-like [Styela clava]